MKTYSTQNIRNVVLLGSTKSGKTTLSEAMLYEGKVIDRRGTVEGIHFNTVAFRQCAGSYNVVTLCGKRGTVIDFVCTVRAYCKISLADG